MIRAAAVALPLLLVTSSAAADLTVGESGAPNRPLIVVLHGDEGSPHKVMGLWRTAAKHHDVIVHAPRCPASAGCRGSWWRWNGDPAWLLARVDELTEAHAIDPDRRYLVGWSGGATYMGMRADRWFASFAAIALAGGGAPGTRCAKRTGPTCGGVYYLMGDRNPHFDLADATRRQLSECGHALHWDLQEGFGHKAEWHAFASKRDTIAEWLLARPRCSAPAPSLASSAAQAPEPAPSLASSAQAAEPAPAPSSHPPAVPPSDPPPASCTCALSPSSHGSWPLLVLTLLAAVRAARRRVS